MLGRKIVQGVNWEPIVSKELFLKANEVLNQFHQPYNHHKEDENIHAKLEANCS